MSFSNESKTELAHLKPQRACCLRAEISAIVHMDGSIHILGQEKLSLDICTENAAVARLVYKYLTETFSLQLESIVRRSILHKVNNYLVHVPDQPNLKQALNEIGILDNHMSVHSGIMQRLVYSNCCAVAYLRGAFLGGGFISNPKGPYHLELTTDNQDFAQDLRDLLLRFELKSRINERKNKFAVYLKDSENILKFLALIGAYKAFLKMEDEKILKEMRSQVNRLVNCDTANVNKAVDAAALQLEDINYISLHLGLEKLPLGLQEFAQVRVEYPYVSLRELGELFNPPLSKSAVNHRARRLAEIARRI